MCKNVVYRFLLLFIGVGLPFSAFADSKKCEELLSSAAVQGVKEEIYAPYEPVVLFARVKAFRRTIENLGKTTHAFAIELSKEVVASEFETVFAQLVEVANLDYRLSFPTTGLAYKYIDVMLMTVNELPPSHPAFEYVKGLTVLKLEYLKASLERPKDGRLN